MKRQGPNLSAVSLALWVAIALMVIAIWISTQTAGKQFVYERNNRTASEIHLRVSCYSGIIDATYVPGPRYIYKSASNGKTFSIDLLGSTPSEWLGLGFGRSQIDEKTLMVAVPLWLVLAVLIPLITIKAIRLRRALLQLRRADSGCCPECGYDLRGSPERCPECGVVPSSAKQAKPQPAEGAAA